MAMRLREAVRLMTDFHRAENVIQLKVVHLLRHNQFLTFGRTNPTASRCCPNGGGRNIDIQLTDHMLLDLWKKFVLLSGTSGMTASTRQSLGVIRDDDDMRAFFYKLMHDTNLFAQAARDGTNIG